MTFAAAALAVFVFVLGLWLFGLVPASANAVDLSRKALRTMRDVNLSDDEKESAVQRASLSLMGSFVSIAGRGIGAFALSIVPIYSFDITGLALLDETVALLETWEMIVGASVVMTAAYFIGRTR